VVRILDTALRSASTYVRSVVAARHICDCPDDAVAASEQEASDSATRQVAANGVCSESFQKRGCIFPTSLHSANLLDRADV
jgi:hypothetical protein